MAERASRIQKAIELRGTPRKVQSNKEGDQRPRGRLWAKRVLSRMKSLRGQEGAGESRAHQEVKRESRSRWARSGRESTNWLGGQHLSRGRLVKGGGLVPRESRVARIVPASFESYESLTRC